MENENVKICAICKKDCGEHHCKICNHPCHAIPPCSESINGDDEEGFGKPVICSKCKKKENKSDLDDTIQKKRATMSASGSHWLIEFI